VAEIMSRKITPMSPGPFVTARLITGTGIIGMSRPDAGGEPDGEDGRVIVSPLVVPAMTRPKILIIEDERPLADALASNLKREGFEVSVAYDGQDGLRWAQVTLPDLIVLDLILPVLPGLEVCRSLRAGAKTRAIPIIMVSAKAEENDELVGFAMGADDYVTKPFSIKVLIERIKRLLGRRGARQESHSGTIIESQGVFIDRHRHRATCRGEELPLTPAEFRLLEAMLRQPGRAYTRHELIDVALGEDTIVVDRTIDVHIKSLRKKLGKAADLIETVWGVGYRFRVPRAGDP
jgi:two-component system phosphate regulon response regulator PhoB